MTSGLIVIAFIILIVILTVYVVFFVGMAKVFETDGFNETLKSYLISFTFLFSINLVGFSLKESFLPIFIIISITNLVLLYLIYFDAKEVDEEISNYFLPLLIVTSILFLFALFVGPLFSSNMFKNKNFFEKKYFKNLIFSDLKK